jgi:HSP20 family protein
MSDTSLQQANGTAVATPETTRSVTLTPRVDVLETEQEILLLADLPGVKQDNVDVRFEQGELTLHARRSFARNEESFVQREVSAADYFRSFRISEKVDAEKIWAELKLGVLTLHLPKAEAAKPRKITVKGG